MIGLPAVLQEQPMCVCVACGSCAGAGTTTGGSPAAAVAQQRGRSARVARARVCSTMLSAFLQEQRLAWRVADAQVWGLSLAEIQRLRWPSGESVPLMRHVLEAVAPRFHHITLDVKVKEQVSTRL